EEALRPRRRRVARDDAVERPVDRHARAEPGERPELGLGRGPAFGLGHEHAAELGAGRRRQALAAADRLPHLAPLLRRRAGPSRLAAAEQRRADELEEVLLLAGRQPARDPLPEVPPFRPALDGARMAQLARQHAPEAADAHLVAGVAEARPEKES